MAKFIEEFYYGNLYPQARSTKQNKTVENFMDVWYNKSKAHWRFSDEKDVDCSRYAKRFY